ncbi:hypothetical protein TNIN_300481 [Trichonephila inaurata madagascariensis]|uniref:Uncharacterized protein n=1 Tax=Trichonephila inaurata madagascariensis TaxID=2747483 RepID=A0A8X6XEP7_9ARAC|nr:hypothetical protein TNIN_300481 [Trichonephila inaurata madagascariensis]
MAMYWRQGLTWPQPGRPSQNRDLAKRALRTTRGYRFREKSLGRLSRIVVFEFSLSCVSPEARVSRTRDSEERARLRTPTRGYLLREESVGRIGALWSFESRTHLTRSFPPPGVRVCIFTRNFILP